MELLAQIVLANQNGITADSFVNTLAIERPEAGPATQEELLDVSAAVHSLFTGAISEGVGVAPLGALIGQQVSRTANACTVNLYDISGKLELGAPDENGRRKPPPHGSPIFVDPFTMPPADYPNALPNQMAAVVTLRSRTALESPVEDGAVRPRQRGTGRIYLGPLNEGAVTNNNTNPKVAQRLLDDATAAFEEMQQELNAAGWALSVWSRTRGMLSVVTSVEVDNSFDVIRSRKIKATYRQKRVFAPVPDLALGA